MHDLTSFIVDYSQTDCSSTSTTSSTIQTNSNSNSSSESSLSGSGGLLVASFNSQSDNQTDGKNDAVNSAEAAADSVVLTMVLSLLFVSLNFILRTSSGTEQRECRVRYLCGTHQVARGESRIVMHCSAGCFL